MNQPPGAPNPVPAVAKDPTFQQQVQRLHELTVWGRWLVVLASWIILAPLCLWELRYPISLTLDYFTWAAVYYGLYFQPWPALGLAFCVALTTAVLVWQSRNILFGLPKRTQRRLERQVLYIRQQGESHPLWQFVCAENARSPKSPKLRNP